MTVLPSAIITLALKCAPNVAPQTVVAIVMAESRGEVFALNVNGASQARMPRNARDGVTIARRYIAAGYSVDLGLGQINSRNMRRLGLTWDTVFNPCENIAALGRVITANYEAALVGREPQTALRVALSMYNTGSPSRGFRNGYVAKVTGNAGATDPTGLQAAQVVAEPAGAHAIAFESDGSAWPGFDRNEPPPSWALFERAAYARQSATASDKSRRKSVWSD